MSKRIDNFDRIDEYATALERLVELQCYPALVDAELLEEVAQLLRDIKAQTP
jgi:hypothetical protein